MNGHGGKVAKHIKTQFKVQNVLPSFFPPQRHPVGLIGLFAGPILTPRPYV